MYGGCNRYWGRSCWFICKFYSGLRGMSVRIIDVQDKLGGKMQLYPEKSFGTLVVLRRSHAIKLLKI